MTNDTPRTCRTCGAISTAPCLLSPCGMPLFVPEETPASECQCLLLAGECPGPENCPIASGAEDQ